MKALAILTTLALLACAPKEDRRGLQRRPITPAATSGWARLPLDGPAQRAWPGLWLSDAEGVAIPFMEEQEGLWQPRALALEQLLLGRSAAGKATAEFSLRFPAGWQIRDREQLKVDLELDGEAPWVCQVELERRLQGSRFLRLETDSPLNLFDLGTSGSRQSFYIPWDAQSYRLTLEPTQGRAPRILGLTVTASTRPDELQADAVLTPHLQRQNGEPGSWSLGLEAPERLVAVDLQLQPPVAPVMARIRVPLRDPGQADPELNAGWLPVQGLVWNLPALHSQATRLSLEPVVTDRLELALPEGAQLASVKLLVRRKLLIFPAEAGRPYFLHTGGRSKPAPGQLGALPASSRAIYAREPLKLGPGEPDPQGLPRIVAAGDRTRPWLPWAAGLVVVLLGFSAWRLLKTEA
jgi:hypothetical protein